MTECGAGLGSTERWVCEDTLPLRTHWFYNTDTVSVTTTQLGQPNNIYRRTLYPPAQTTELLQLRYQPTLNLHTGDMFKVKGGCTQKHRTRYLTGKYQHGLHGSGLTTMYTAQRQRSECQNTSKLSAQRLWLFIVHYRADAKLTYTDRFIIIHNAVSAKC